MTHFILADSEDDAATFANKYDIDNWQWADYEHHMPDDLIADNCLVTVLPPHYTLKQQ